MQESEIKKQNNTLFLFFILFCSGMSVMGMEMTASRVLAPFFGSSVLVWTNIIAIVMVSLALGYYGGGLLADKSPKVEILYKTLMASGVFFLLTPFLLSPLFNFLMISDVLSSSSWLFVFIGSLMASIIVLACPLMFLGMVSPFVLKLLSQGRHEDIGSISGKVFAISTLGSILGTFLPTLVLIPKIGTQKTIFLFAFLVIFLGVWGLLKSRFKIFSLLVFILIPFLNVNFLNVASASVLFSKDSPYQHIKVLESGESRYLVYNEGFGIQSVYNPNQILTEGMYYDYYNLFPSYLNKKEKPLDVLILGLAGGTIARQMNYFWGNKVTLEGVEIDKEVIHVAKEYMGLKDVPVKIYEEDARVFLNRNEKKYDLIIVDAYSNEMYIPWTLLTKEFWHELKSNLREEGMVALNINASKKNSELLLIAQNTMTTVFKNIYQGEAKNDSDLENWNYILIGMDRNFETLNMNGLDLPKELHSRNKTFLKTIAPVYYQKNLSVFTDDWAPVEWMTDKMILDYIF